MDYNYIFTIILLYGNDKIIQFHFSLIIFVLVKFFIELNNVTFNDLKSNCYQ